MRITENLFIFELLGQEKEEVDTNNRDCMNPDSAEKEYWRREEEFADLFNAYLYDGRSVIRAEELEEQDTDVSCVLDVSDARESVKGARDVVRLAKRYHGTEYAILAIENQEGIHYGMPIRVMGYDHYTYRKQYDERRADYKLEKYPLKGDEFLSGIRRDDRFLPVVTLVLYYGEEPWDGPTCLHDMLEMDEELRPFVNDYRLHIVELRKNNLRLHNQNNIDLFRLMSIIFDKKKTRAERRESIREYELQHDLEDVVVDTIAAATNVSLHKKKGEKLSVCTLWDEVRAEGREEGRAEGKAVDILALLSRRGVVSANLHDYVMVQTDEAVLTEWLFCAADARSVEEFAEKIAFVQ